MYSLHLWCKPDDVDVLSAELWENGTAGIREVDEGDGAHLIAGFEDNTNRSDLSARFVRYSPEWEQEESIDWIQQTHEAWPPRSVGERVFLAPPWTTEPTPPGRVRVIHNPGLASGTGEHPCTRLALEALEQTVKPGCTVADIGTGSGILALAALQLGARFALALDLDELSLSVARENFHLNGKRATMAVGSADCVRDRWADVTVANISGTVLLAVMDDLLRFTKDQGTLILTGMPEWELLPFQQLFPDARITALNEWRCLTETQG